MAYTTRQAVTVLSIIYLLALTALAGYALHLTRHLSLPHPTLLSALTLILPSITGLALESTTALSRHDPTHSVSLAPSNKSQNAPSRSRTRLLLATTFTLTILTTCLTTLSGSYIPSASQTCPLESQWARLFQKKDEIRIRRVQDSLQCCGLRTTSDRAWPFPARNVDVGACVARFPEREGRACLQGWSGVESKAAGVMLGVGVGCWIWMILILLSLSSSSTPPSWLTHPSQLLNPNRRDDARADLEQASRPALEYTDNPAPIDELADDGGSSAQAAAVQRALGGVQRDADVDEGSPLLDSRGRGSRLRDRDRDRDGNGGGGGEGGEGVWASG